MKRRNATRNALLMSVIAMLLCVTMLVGTTYAWFTDSVTNGHNVIHSGNLDISLWHNSCANTDYGFGYNEATGEEVLADTVLFLNLDGEEILWEPGAVGTDTFRIKNDGTLALKYAFTIKAYGATETADGHDLTEVLNVAAAEFDYNEFGTPFTPAGGYYDMTGKLLEEGYTIEGSLLPGESVDYWMTLEWIPTDHDNDYNVAGGLDVNLCVELLATQFTYEVDSYNGDQYDKNAEYPTVSAPVVEKENIILGDVYPTDEIVSFANTEINCSIVADETYPTIAFEKVTGNLSLDLKANNTVIMQDCDFTSLEVINNTGRTDLQVIVDNVTVNGVKVTNANLTDYFTAFADGNVMIWG